MLSNLSTSNSKAPLSQRAAWTKLAIKFFWFTPLALIFFLDTLMPIDFFNHRVWETLCVMRPSAVLKGFFYPRIRLVKYEAPINQDFYHGHDVRKTTEWITDRYGYRKQEPYQYPQTIAVIGDSNMAGSGMTQKDLFSEVLEQKLGTGVYPLAPGGIESLFFVSYFRNHPPKILIASHIERNLTKLGRYDNSPRQKFFSFIPFLQKMETQYTEALLSNPLMLKWGIFADRFFYKKTLAQCMKAKLLFHPPPAPEFSSKEKEAAALPLLFFQGDEANRDFSEPVLEATAEIYRSYRDACQKQGIRFIFMPIPNKENIYYEMLPNKTKPVFLEKLFDRLRQKGVEVLDLQKVYEDFRVQHPEILLFDPEEAHWNAAAVRLAAEAVKKHLENPAV